MTVAAASEASHDAWGSNYGIRMQEHADEIERRTRAQSAAFGELETKVTEVGLGAHEVYALVQELRQRLPSVEFYGVWSALAPGKERKAHKPRSATVVARRDRLEKTQRDQHDALLLCAGVCGPALEPEAALHKAEGMFALSGVAAFVYVYSVLMCYFVGKSKAIVWSALVSRLVDTEVSAPALASTVFAVAAVLVALMVACLRRTVPLRERVCEVQQHDAPECVAWHARVLAAHVDAPGKNVAASTLGTAPARARARAKRAA